VSLPDCCSFQVASIKHCQAAAAVAADVGVGVAAGTPTTTATCLYPCVMHFLQQLSENKRKVQVAGGSMGSSNNCSSNSNINLSLCCNCSNVIYDYLMRYCCCCLQVHCPKSYNTTFALPLLAFHPPATPHALSTTAQRKQKKSASCRRVDGQQQQLQQQQQHQLVSVL